MTWQLYAEIDGSLHLLTDCIWLFQRPCGCACQVIPATPAMASADQAWKEIYAADKRTKRRVDYAKRDGFTLSLIARPTEKPQVYPVSELCAHRLHVPNTQRVIRVGEQSGRLTAISERQPQQPNVRAVCECSTEALIPIGQWGTTRSCGCLKRETTIARSTTHGMSRTSEYDIWSAMVQRATNPKNARYADYGGRGIGVCDRWLEFANFHADMGRRPAGMSLDRIDNDRGYGPENCRWATAVEQRHNQRPHRLRTHCKNGHEFSTENTRINSSGSRSCRTCDRARSREYKARKAAAT